MKKISLLLLLIVGLLLSGCGKTAVIEEVEGTEEPAAAPEVFRGGSLTLSIEYGYDKYVKNGRYMPVLADITNEGADFSGTLQVIVPAEEGKSFMYQKEVVLAAGETKRLEMAIPVGSSAMRYNFVLADEEGRAVAEKSVKAYIYREDKLFAGILTDDAQGLSYLSNSRIKMFYLEAETFPEEVMGLDSLDILIINDFNTEKLNDKQYEAVKSFVMRGGTLVLGCGATGAKTLAAFDDSFISGKMGEVFSKQTTFGLNEEGLLEIKNQLLREVLDQDLENTESEGITQLAVNPVKKDIMEIHLEGAVTLVEENDVVLLEGLYKGKGRVLLSTMDLGLDTGLRDTIGREVANQIADNISPEKRIQLNEERTGNGYQYLKHSAVDVVEEGKIPKVGRYIIILLAYLLLIGPPLYFLLKKLDKRNLIWVIVPVFSVLFASFIYGIGGETRQDKPYINFFTINTQRNGICNQETLLGVTAPYNDDYELTFSRDTNIVPEVEMNTYYYQGASQSSKDNSYNIGIRYGADAITVQVKDYPAFETAYFNVTGEGTTAGAVENSLSFFDLSLKGSITNRLGYDLKQAVVYAYGKLYPIGDLEQGQSISLDEKESFFTMNRSGIYQDGLLEKISGGSPYGKASEQTAEIVRYYYAYEYILSKLASKAQQSCYLIGFPEEKKNEFLENTGLNSYGVTILMAEIEPDLTKEEERLIPRLDIYMQNIDERYDGTEGYVYSDNYSVELQFGSEEKIDRLLYSAQMNGGLKGLTYPDSFYGEIFAWNYSTEEYDVIFDGKQEGFIEAAPYLGEENRMRLSIRPDAMTLQRYGQVAMPVLSAIEEE